MTDSFDKDSDFQKWEEESRQYAYEQRRDKVDADLESAYRNSPELAAHAGLKAMNITGDFIRAINVTSEENLGQIYLAMKKVGFMFSNPGDELDHSKVLPMLIARYERNNHDMAKTAESVERYVTYLNGYWKQTADRAGDAWMDYSSDRAWEEVTSAMEANVEADFGETDI